MPVCDADAGSTRTTPWSDGRPPRPSATWPTTPTVRTQCHCYTLCTCILTSTWVSSSGAVLLCRSFRHGLHTHICPSLSRHRQLPHGFRTYVRRSHNYTHHQVLHASHVPRHRQLPLWFCTYVRYSHSYAHPDPSPPSLLLGAQASPTSAAPRSSASGWRWPTTTRTTRPPHRPPWEPWLQQPRMKVRGGRGREECVCRVSDLIQPP